MKLLALATPKKEMRVSMTHLYGNNYTMTAGAGHSSAATPSGRNMGTSALLQNSLGGASISCVGTADRKTLVDITGQVLLGYIVLPYFEDTSEDLTKAHVIYLNADGVEYKFDMRKGESYKGRLLSFNAAANTRGSLVWIKKPWSLFSENGGLHCKTNLKIEIEAVGYGDYAHCSTSYKENQCHIVYQLIEVDGSMIDGQTSSDAGTYNKKIEDFINV